ncbi:hypothetical protein AMTR_s00096p00055800 [Amborella trichopoda]|uniref:Uncharacterized protein n=1 Tax=Amborella trichopoda TaxID=13333 RepID=W1NXL9_AMBTC|nr:hypothetical protein AMTR_s00096p00055800 [Amborella trichopoda]
MKSCGETQYSGEIEREEIGESLQESCRMGINKQRIGEFGRGKIGESLQEICRMDISKQRMEEYGSKKIGEICRRAAEWEPVSKE